MAFPSIGARFSEVVHTGGLSSNENNTGARWSNVKWTVRRVFEDPQAIWIGVDAGGWEHMARADRLRLGISHHLWTAVPANGRIIAVGLWAGFFVAFFRKAGSAALRLRPQDRLWPMAEIASMISLVAWSMGANYLNHGRPVVSLLVASMTRSACERLQDSVIPRGVPRDA